MKVINLNKNIRLGNACKRAGLILINPKGAYNGFGYAKLPLAVEINTPSELYRFKKLKKEIEGENKPVIKTDAEKNITWTKRLSSLTGLSVNECAEIAQEKLDYKQQQIDEIEEKQVEHYSQERGKLIKKMQKENPLRLIKNKEHAEAIRSASNRHKNTDYEALLEEGREKAASGEIDKGEVKDYARQHFKQ